ncbi:MAG: hypothetical protein AAB439_03820 [Patescibacteria group bacterium]
MNQNTRDLIISMSLTAIAGVVAGFVLGYWNAENHLDYFPNENKIR